MLNAEIVPGANLAGANNDAILVAMAKTGDTKAFEQLVQRHYHACVHLASFILRDRSEAQDQVQEACRKAFEHLNQYQGDADFVSWMRRIVVNQCLMLLRVRRKTHFFYLDGDRSAAEDRTQELPANTPDPEYELLGSELREVLRREIRHIPPLLRNVMLLCDLQELPMAVVAGRLGISVAAAKSRLLRARAELRKRVLTKSGNAKHQLPVEAKVPAKSSRRIVRMG
jgi:RNA polymerase sigma-70 factor, ECF subfamily